MSKEILQYEFELIKQDLIDLYNKKGMRVTGKWADSLNVTANEMSVTLYGEKYSQQLETGRKAGKFPPIEQIKKWIIEKGVFASALQTIKLSSLAFLIARKIANSGWKREGHGGVNLISEVITPDRIQSIIDKLGAEALISFTTEIVGFLNELEVV